MLTNFDTDDNDNDDDDDDRLRLAHAKEELLYGGSGNLSFFITRTVD